MRLNEHQAILTPQILLVPYSEHHVLTYHSWMQDEELQKATASEPLSLPQEYAMQRSWRSDADKLTFIVCTAPPSTLVDQSKDEKFKVQSSKHDSPDSMIGDVNLFLYADDEANSDPDITDSALKNPPTDQNLQGLIGEVEIMIARSSYQNRGYGTSILLTFLWYIIHSSGQIAQEYHATHNGGKTRSHIKYLRVKISAENSRSIKLFEKAGFKKVDEKPNYFGELELQWPVSEFSASKSDIEIKMNAVPLIVAYS